MRKVTILILLTYIVVQPIYLYATEITGQMLVSTAQQYIGRKYLYGAEGPYFFDCSGFVRYCSRQYGLQLPRTAQQQAGIGSKVIGGLDSLKTGDLIFFGRGRVQHVGIYIACTADNRHRFIHCSNSHGVAISSIEEPYWRSRYKYGRRFLDDPGYGDFFYEDTEEVQDIGSEPIIPIQSLGSDPIAPESYVGLVPIPCTKHWKIRVNRKNQKTVVFAQ